MCQSFFFSTGSALRANRQSSLDMLGTAGFLKSRLPKLFTQADGLDSYLHRGLSATFLISVAGKGMAFATGIVLARFMGPSGLGVYALAIAVAQLLRLPSAFGLPGVVVRYVSLYDTEQCWSLMRGLLKSTAFLTLIISVSLAATGSIVVWLLSDRLGAEKATALLLALWMVPFLDLAGFRGATLQGLRRVVLAQIPDVLLRPILLLALLGLAWKLARASELGPVLVLQIHLLVLTVTFVIGVYMLQRAIPPEVWATTSTTDFPRWRNSLLPFMFIHAAQMVLSQTDTIMLGILSTDTNVGLYRVAWQAAALMTFGLGIVNIVIQPMISRLHSQGDRARLQRMLTLTTRLSVAVTIPVALGLFAAGPWLLSVVFGGAYGVSYAPMMILVVGQLVNVAAGSVGLLLFMTGHERDAAWSIGLATGLNIVLDAALIPGFGIEGAASASAISLVVWNVSLLRRVRRHLGVHPTVFGRYL